MSQPDSINLTTSHSANPQPSFLLLLHLLPHPPHSVASKVQMHTLTHTHTIPWLNSSSLALSFPGTPRRSSPPLERTWGRGEKGKKKNGARQRDQLNYKNNAGWINWLFFSRVEPQCGMNLNGEEWEKHLRGFVETRGCFSEVDAN